MSESLPPPSAHGYSAEKEFAYLGIEQPEHIVQSIVEITSDLLHNMGVELLMIDIDGTITGDGSGLQGVTQEAINHINDLSRDFDACFVTMSSRSTKDIQKCFEQTYPVFGVTSLPNHLRTPESAPWATKFDHPERYFGRALHDFDIEPEKAVAIGDEIGADIVAPRSLGIKTILVDGFNMERIEKCLSDPIFMKYFAEHEKQTWRRSQAD